MANNKERKSTGLDNFLDDLTGKHSKRANAILQTMDDEDFLVAFYKGLEYAAPKLQRKEIVEADKTLILRIEHVEVPKVGEGKVIEIQEKKDGD